MKRIISMLMALCLTAALGLAAAEEAPSVGKPYANPNMLNAFPAQPGPEENYFIFANYDPLVRGAAEPFSVFNDERTRGYYYLAEQALEICRNPEYTDTDSQIVQIVYSLAADKEKRERDGFAALTERVSRVKAVRSTEELTALLREEGFLISMPFFSARPQPWDENDPMYMVSAGRLPVLEYLPSDDYTEPVLDRDTPRERLVLMQYSEEEARRLVEEIEQYDNYFPEVEPEWAEKPLVTLNEIRENCPPLYAMLCGVGLVREGAETLPMYAVGGYDVGAFQAWYTDENLEALKAIVLLRLYDDTVKCLNSDSFKNYTGKDNILLFDVILQAAHTPMSQAYITHYCPEERWAMATGLFEEIRAAMRERILASAWLSEESKNKAVEKLDNLILLPIVPPDGSFDFAPLLEALRGCSNLPDATALCHRYENLFLMRYAGEPLERENPYTAGNGVLNVGGAYLPESNLFFIGAPSLDGAFCDPTSRETLLGTLGMHIGHELSHGYDAYGAMRDLAGTGTLFTDEDMTVFREKSASIAAGLSLIESGNGNTLPGEQLVYEAMADMTGMTLMLDLAKKDENFDYDAFFRAYAGLFFNYETGRDYHPDSTGRVDPHPPSYVRINYTVAHFEEFYRTYPTVTEGTPMYIAPENRILAW